jgi:CBS domain-containing protein
MRVDQIMSRPVHVCLAEDSLARAAGLMWEHDCGSLAVVGGDGGSRIVGMITDRDVCMCALFEKQPLEGLQVSRAMSKRVRTCRPYDELPTAEEILRTARLRRLPVVDDNGGLVGMVTLADLAREASRERSTPQRDITERAVGHTLGGICRPRHRDLVATADAGTAPPGDRYVG